MGNSQFEKCFNRPGFILTEGGVVERLKSEYHIVMDRYINHAGLIYDCPDILAILYKQYIEVARQHNVPIMLMTPTRKVNFETLRKSGFHDNELIIDSCRFLRNIRKEYTDFADQIFIGGLLGCKGDAYQSEGALSDSESFAFHRIQVAEFRKEEVDFLFAGIMPAISEAIGMARAMAESEIPYIISFMVRKDGCLIDGTSIADAIKIIDQNVSPQPVCYMANCIHPLNLILALENEFNLTAPQLTRFLGIQANSSSLSPEELNNCGILKQEDYDDMVDEMGYLMNKYNFKILGGCCGTNDVFLNKLAVKLKECNRHSFTDFQASVQK
jgi:S-methylmethionine-dependent homocysteine/selenocysteine methylase